MVKSTLSVARQESVLACLCFYQEEASTIRGALSYELFGSAIYRDIARRALEYLDEYGEVVGSHLADVFDDILEGDDSKKASLYDEVLRNLYLSKDTINPNFVVETVRDFVRVQTLKSNVTSIAEKLQDGDVEAAESLLNKTREKELQLFNPGLVLRNNPGRFLAALDNQPIAIPTGIPYFEKIDLGPTKKELLVVLAPPNRGKSWALMHLGKFALLNRKKVLHLTLEMSEERCAQRYLQSFFSVSKRDVDLRVPILSVDEKGTFVDFDYDTEIKRPSFKDPETRQLLFDRLVEMQNRLPLVIKQFPTNQLTPDGLDSYVYNLERQFHFIPDLIILDYADLMRTRSSSLREDLSFIYKDLRGFGISGDYAMATASQSNRSSEEVKVVTLKHLAEDYTKAATADMVISYNQTPWERQLGLARLFTAKHRNDEVGSTILISQCYPIGQFALQSCMLTSNYWDVIESQG